MGKRKRTDEPVDDRTVDNTPHRTKSDETKSSKKKRRKQLEEVELEEAVVNTPTSKKRETKSEKKKRRTQFEEVTKPESSPELKKKHQHREESHPKKKNKHKPGKEVEVEKAMAITPSDKKKETKSEKPKRRKQLEEIEQERPVDITPTDKKSDESKSAKKKRRKQSEEVEVVKATVNTPTNKTSEEAKSEKKTRRKKLEEVEEVKVVNNKSVDKKTQVTKSAKKKHRIQQEEVEVEKAQQSDETKSEKRKRRKQLEEEDASNGKSAKKKRRIDVEEVEEETKSAKKKRRKQSEEVEVEKAMVGTPTSKKQTKSEKRKQRKQLAQADTPKSTNTEMTRSEKKEHIQPEEMNTPNGKNTKVTQSAKKKRKKKKSKKIGTSMKERLENGGKETNADTGFKCQAFEVETIEKLKEQWKEKNVGKKSSMHHPKLFLYEDFASSKDSKETSKPLELQDIQDLIQFTVLMGTFSNIPRIRFCKILRVAKIPKVVVIVVNGVTEKCFQKNRKCFPHLTSHYSITGNFKEPAKRGSLLKKLYFVKISTSQTNKRKLMNKEKGKPTSGTDKENKSNVKSKEPDKSNIQEKTPGKLPFLMSKEDMAKWRFPSPNDRSYVHTKYSKAVTESSPLISVDCEMCVTRAGSELTRVSLVNENYKVLYDSLVKPRNPIINYVTKFSGITKKLLDPVTTRIEDIQRDIIALLPRDTILVGQSIENDLRALKMYHPHIIDSSTLFTHTYRLALRKLTKQYLDWEIQKGDGGHDSIEDSVAALKLVQLKINGGKGVKGGLEVKKPDPVKKSPPKEPVEPIVPVESMFMASHAIGKVNMIVDCEYMASKFFRYPVGVLPCQTDKEAVITAVERIPTSDFVSVQFYDYEKMIKWCPYTEADSKEELQTQDKRIEEIYKTLPLGSMFVVIMGDFTVNDPNPSADEVGGRFFTGLKV